MTGDVKPYARRWPALMVLAASLLVVSIGNTILNLALPSIRDDLDASSSELQWILDGHMLVFAGLLLVAGSLGDRFGRRRTLFVGLATFGLGSLLAALAPGTTELIASRALMGVGAAAIMPVTLSVVTNNLPGPGAPEGDRALVGGRRAGRRARPDQRRLADRDQRLARDLPAQPARRPGLCDRRRDPRARVARPQARPARPGRRRTVDRRALLARLRPDRGARARLERPADPRRVRRRWRSSSPRAAAASLIGAAFIAWERRVVEPMLQVRVFRNLRFSAASASIAFVYFALMGVLYMNTTYLQTVLGHSALDAGLRLLAPAAGMILASRPSVALASRLGAKVVVASGLAIVAGSLLMFAGFDSASSDGEIALVLGLLGFGIGLGMTPATEAIMGSLPPAKAGIGSAMNDVVREVAGTLGIAVLGSILSSTYARGMDTAVTGLPNDAANAASDSVGAAHEVAGNIGGSTATELISAANDAFIDALATTATIAAAIAVAGAVIAAAFLPARERAAPAGAGGEIPEPAPA